MRIDIFVQDGEDHRKFKQQPSGNQYMRRRKRIEYKVFSKALRFVERMFKLCTKSPDIMKSSK